MVLQRVTQKEKMLGAEEEGKFMEEVAQERDPIKLCMKS